MAFGLTTYSPKINMDSDRKKELLDLINANAPGVSALEARLEHERQAIRQQRYMTELNKAMAQYQSQTPLGGVSGNWAANFGAGMLPRRDVLTDVRRMIHRENGPAVYLDNGTVLYYWHGTNVPEWVIMNPEKITLRRILKEQNIELRRVLIERFGEGRFIKELGAEKIHEDKYGILWEARRDKLMENKIDSLSDRDVVRIFGHNRRIKYVQVQDASTPHEYFIPVPSTMKRAKQAIAWSFQLKEEEYNPQIET